MALMMAAALYVGCGGSGDEPGGGDPTPQPQPGEKAIAFYGNLAESKSENYARTRAEEALSSKGITTFYAWAYKNPTVSTYEAVMKKYTVKWTSGFAGSTTTNSSGWEYVNQQSYDGMEQSVKYWDFDAKSYRFFGTTSSSTGSVVTEAGKTFYRMTFFTDATELDECPFYSKLWFSDNSAGSSAYGNAVKLVFLQPVSYVRFKFIFEDENDAPKTELTDKKFEPTDGNTIKYKGLVHIDYPLTGTGVSDKEATLRVADGAAGQTGGLTQDYYESIESTTVTDPVTGEDKQIVTSPYYLADPDAIGKVYSVLPTPTGQSSYRLDVSVNGEPKNVIVPSQYMTWQPGYIYTYVFKIHVDSGVSISSVESAFTNWYIEENKHNVYNW